MKRLVSIFTILAFLIASSPVEAFARSDRILTVLTIEEMHRMRGGCTPEDVARTKFPSDCGKECADANVALPAPTVEADSKCVCVENEPDPNVPGAAKKCTKWAYRSSSPGPSAYGYNWILNYGGYLTEEVNGNVTEMLDDGTTTTYTKTNGTYTSPVGSTDWTLSKNPDGSFKLEYKEGTRRNYDIPDGTGHCKLLTILDAIGRAITLNYTGALLTSIGMGGDGTFTLTYNANNMLEKMHCLKC